MAARPRTKNAYWIGVPDEAWKAVGQTISRSDNITAYFRYTFSVTQPGKLVFKISANSRYRLWVNGRPILSGPLKGDGWRQYYETVDVSKHLRPGFNCIAVKVVAYPAYESDAGSNMAPLSVMSCGAGPMLMVDGVCKTDKGRILADVTTGYGDWQVALDQAIEWTACEDTHWAGPMEKVSGDMLPHGWLDQEEAEGDWYRAQSLWLASGDPSDVKYGLIPPMPLEERPVPLLYEVRRYFQKEMPVFHPDRERMFFSSLIEGTSVTLEPNSRYIAVLDAGELTTGYIVLKMQGGAGSTIRLRYSESYYRIEDGMPVKDTRDDAANGVIIGHYDEYMPSGAADVYEPFWFRTFRFVQIEIDTAREPLSIEPPFYLETGYPLEVQTSVQSTVPWVNQVWDISIRTLRRTVHETFENSTYYEQLQYLADTRLQILYTYMVSSDTHLARKALHDFRCSLMPGGLLQARYPSRQPQVIPIYNIYFIFMVEDYYWQTGETEHIREYRSVIDGILEWFDKHMGKSGLIENLGYWPFVDWVEGWDRGVPPAAEKGPATVHNLIYAAGLQAAARLNELTGRKYMADEYLKRAKDILQQVENLCWDDETGLYKEGPKVSRYSQHDQVWAVLTGLVKGKRAKSLMRKSFALDDIDKCSRSMQFYLLRALERTNMYDRSEVIWDAWKHMLEKNLTTCPGDSGHERSDCSGRSALALYEFTRCILGVRPLEPGWTRIGIQPNVLSLPDFSGSVITPKGMVHVSWKVESGLLSISGQVPEGVPLELFLPDGTKQLYLNGGSFEF
ncbi:MAG: family 78 glycoside hydrolase catalytic domain [Clostridiales bacterium]|nr:family 78 glycoside hydrolase catalytic domain [Clostridiales bacterium]